MLQLRMAPGARGLLTANAVHRVVEAHRHELARALKEREKSYVRDRTSKAETAIPSPVQVKYKAFLTFKIWEPFSFRAKTKILCLYID